MRPRRPCGSARSGRTPKKLEDGATLLFIDQAGYSLTSNRRKAWARHGIVPIMRRSFRSWRKLSAQSAVAVRKTGKRYEVQLIWRLRPKGTVRTKQVVEFLHQCAARLGNRVVVIWGNSSTHKSAGARNCIEGLGWERVQLPPYCPGFDCDENVWNWTKQQDLANGCPRDRAELLANVKASLRRLAKHASALQWIRKNTELDWP